MNGSALAINRADEHVPAIIDAWYPGGQGGRAVADLIAGDFSPSERLPVTFYRAAVDLPPFNDYRMAGRTYRYFRGTPLYPFGHGLSYTDFRYRGLKFPARITAGQPFELSFTLTNAGPRDGAEVVQVYVSRAGAGAPIRSLKGFQRITLKAGDRRRLHFTLGEDALRLVDERGRRVIAPGTVCLWIGGAQPGSRTSAGVAGHIIVQGSEIVAH